MKLFKTPTRQGATLYIADDSRPAIIAALHRSTANGIWFEQENPILLENWRDAAALGNAINEALDRFSTRTVKSFRDRKPSDWPAYKASGLKTIKSFERTYLRFDITAENDAGSSYRIEAKPRGEDNINLSVTVNQAAPPAELGRHTLRLFEGV